MTQLNDNKLSKADQEIHVDLERFERDVLFVWNRLAEWRQLYMNKWIAVHNERIVAVADDLDVLNAELATLDIRRGEIYVEIIKASYSNAVPLNS